jgi:hypothetical protein
MMAHKPIPYELVDPARVVTTDGVVFVDADIPPHGWTDTGIAPMSADQARRLALQLFAAADEVDKLTGGTLDALLTEAARHAREAASRAADAQVAAGFKLDGDAVTHVVALLLASERELQRLGQAVQ